MSSLLSHLERLVHMKAAKGGSVHILKGELEPLSVHECKIKSDEICQQQQQQGE